jgi:catechol 2,3-dioxygenase-like lactoylglutathione lyase family enzyme
MTPPALGAVHWRGVNHLALITPDMDATVRFWHGVLGAELAATIATPEFRHYFFRIGEHSTVAFFEYRGVDIPRIDKVAGIPDDRAAQFDHLALDLPDNAALAALQQQLRDAGCEVTEVIDHTVAHSVYFTDSTASPSRPRAGCSAPPHPPTTPGRCSPIRIPCPPSRSSGATAPWCPRPPRASSP